MRFRVAASAVAFTLAHTLFVPDARADIPPQNACSAVGSPCSTGGDSYDKPGVCTQTRCHRVRPGPNGMQEVDYDCNLCVAGTASNSTTATSSGAGDSTSSGAAIATTSSGSGASPQPLPPRGGCASCSVSDGRAGVVAFVSIMSAALIAGGLGARRRTRNTRE